MELYYIPLIILILASSFKPFIKKIVFNKIGIPNTLFLSMIVNIVFTGCCLYYYKYNIKDLSKISNKKTMILLLSSYILGYAGYVSYIYLTKKYDITKLKPIYSPLSMILIAILGIYIFKEKLTMNQIYGIITIITGTIIFSLK